MITFHIFFIAIIQGITEFLPISSSAHLIILPYLMKVSDQGVIIDISAHLGSLLALIIYFKKDSTILFKGLIQFFFLKTKKKEAFFFVEKIKIWEKVRWKGKLSYFPKMVPQIFSGYH